MSRPWLQPLVLIVVALAVRSIYLVEIADSPLWVLLLGDAQRYDAWAREIAGGAWLGDRVFYQAPLYPYFLAVVYAVAGHSLLAVRLVQVALGSVACGLLGLAATRWVSPRAGWIAGLTLALYPPAFFFDALIQKSALDSFFMALLLALLALSLTPGRRWWLPIGMTLGLLALTRENALVFVPCALAWAVLGPAAAGQAWRSRAVPAALLLVGLALVLLPVAMRNQIVGGEFHLTTSQLGPNFYIGNHAKADGSYTPLRFARGNAAFEADDARALAEQELGRPLRPAEVSDYWLNRALDQIAADPARWVRLMLRKTLLTWNAVEVGDTEDQYTYAESSLLLRGLGLVGHMGLLVPLAVLGTVVSFPQWRRLWVLHALVLVYAASVIAFYVFARYRLPLVPMLILLKAGGLAMLPEVWRRRRSLVMLGLGLAVPAAVVANWPLVDVQRYRGMTHHNIAVELMNQRGEVEPALEHLVTALALAPSYAPAHNAMGIALARLGRFEEALPHYQQALALQPDYADAHYNRGLALARLNRADEAALAYAQALHHDPGHALTHQALGLLMARAGRLDEAIGHYRQALACDPALAEAHNNMGVAFARLGRLREAAAAFAEAVRLQPDYADAQANLQRARRALQDAPGGKP